MTDKQIEQREDELRTIGRERTLTESLYDGLSKREINEMEELRCRSMMSSIFCYSGIDAITDESSYKFNTYLKKYKDKFGAERFEQIRNEQLEDYSHCVIEKNTYTDCDGCAYNTIHWNAK